MKQTRHETPSVDALSSAIRFTDPEAIRLITSEAALTAEPLARVTARVIVRYFASRDARDHAAGLSTRK